ncbi:hypothetical protein [Lacinutrix sp. Bg11-31]|uniref:hypothetical protein n=1 Tax=Lacinutrix sp. Bg11-31 TaxID=2057808 RepID=UPI0026CD80AF
MPRYARLECPDGEATLSIYFSETPSNNNTTLYFEDKNLDILVQELKKKMNNT